MREISKLPAAPKYSEKLVTMVSDLLFSPDAPAIKDKIFQILGNIAFLDSMMAKLKTVNLQSAYAVISSGGINPAYKEDTEETGLVKMLFTAGGKRDWNTALTTPESKIILDEMDANNIKHPDVILEKTSTNMLENFTKIKKNKSFQIISPSQESIVLLTTSESALRAKLTAKTAFPAKNIETISYNAAVPAMNIVVSKNRWAETDLGKKFVWGEILRLSAYSDKSAFALGDINKVKLFNIIFEAHRRG